MKFPKNLADKLEARKQNNALRQLPSQTNLVDFASNDYLGLAGSALMAEAARAALQAEGSALAGVESLGGGRYRLLAPMDGVVVARALQVDQPVAAWSAAFVIADPARLAAVIQVPAERAGVLRVGDAVRLLPKLKLQGPF